MSMDDEKVTGYIPTTGIAEAATAGELDTGQMVRINEDALPAEIRDADSPEDDYDDEFEYERIGFIIDIHEDNFTHYDEDADEGIEVVVDDGETVYLVGLGLIDAGAHPFYAEDLEPLDRDDVLGDMDVDAEPEDVEEAMDMSTEEASGQLDAVELQAGVSDVPGLTRNQMGLQPWPYSWRNSNKPARLIAMDAWISMGRSFRGCRRSVVGNIRNPNRFCAAFKDAIYGHPYWREGGG